VDDWLVRQNIENYELLLRGPLKREQRRTVETLLAEARGQLARLEPTAGERG